MTTYLVDTSVAVPLVLASHVAHDLTNQTTGERVVHLAGHAAVETYSVLTRLPGDARLTASDAMTLLAARFAGAIVPTSDLYPEFLGRLAAVGVAGGAVYDGLVGLAGLETSDSVLLSRDLRAAATYARLGVAVELIVGGD